MGNSDRDDPATWMTYEALVAVVRGAAAVRVVEGAEIDWRRRKRTADVIRIDQEHDIAALVEALQFDEPVSDVEWMQWPTLTFGFATAHREILAELSYLRPGWLRHAVWPGDQPLSDPDRIETWLAMHGWGPTAV